MRMSALLCLAALLSPTLAFADSGEAAPKRPFSMSLEGPATVPVMVSVKPAAGARAATLWFDIYQDGKALKRVSVPNGRTGTVNLVVPAGKHSYEFRAEDPNLSLATFTWTPPGAAVAMATPTPMSMDIGAVTSAGGETLSRPYAPTIGEMIATDIGQLLGATRPMGPDVQTMAHYAKDSRRLVISILGPTQTADEAKAAIDYLRKQAWEPMDYRVETLYGIRLTDAEVTIRYLDRSKDYDEVMRRENGRFVIP